MILFKDDWHKHRGAIRHLSTTNKTAIKMAFVYKTMGVENWDFCLALHNPLLQDVNPHDPDLDQNTKAMILEELQDNPWYYFREIALVPAKGAIVPVRFRLNRANLALYWCYFNHATTLLIQTRQTGKSLSTDQLYVWLIEYGTFNYTIELLTKDNKLRVTNVDRVKQIIGLLPSWANYRTKKDANNSEYVNIGVRENIFNTNVAQMTEAGAIKVGRGLTAPTVGIDEICFTPNLAVTLGALLPSLDAATDSAKEAGQPFGTMFYTTAGFLDDDSGEYVYDNIYKKAYYFDEKLFDTKDNDDFLNVVKQVSRGSIVLIEMNHRKLGYSDEWLRDKMAKALAKGERAAADYLLIWSRGKMTAALDKKIIKRLENSIRDPGCIEISPQGMTIEWYVDEDEREQYTHKSFVFGLDTSNAFGDDDIGFHARDPITGATIAKGKYNMLSLNAFGEFIFWFMKKYKKSTLIIERHSSAMGILDHLASLFSAINENIFTRVFNWVVDDYKLKHKEFIRMVSATGNIRDTERVYVENKKKFGFATTGAGRSSRGMLYSDVLMESLKFTGDLTYDRNLAYQMIKLEVKDGRIDHKSGEHDDLVFAYMLTYWFLTRAKNLKYYGFTPNLVLSNVMISDVDMVQEKSEMETRSKKKIIIEEITKTLELMETEVSRIRVHALNNRLRVLRPKLNDTDVFSLNIEERIRELSKKHKVKI